MKNYKLDALLVLIVIWLAAFFGTLCGGAFLLWLVM